MPLAIKAHHFGNSFVRSARSNCVFEIVVDREKSLCIPSKYLSVSNAAMHSRPRASDCFGGTLHGPVHPRREYAGTSCGRSFLCGRIGVMM